MAGGRPTSITPDVLQKLEQAFLMGCTDVEACLYADVAPSTMYLYASNNEAFSERKETLKQNPVMKARGIILDALGDKCISTANKVIDRKEGSKVAVSGDVTVKHNWSVTGVTSA